MSKIKSFKTASRARHGRSSSSSRVTPYNLKDLHRLFTKHPDLETKYLNSISLPITGKEQIYFPYEFTSHRNNTCLDFSPYGNQQISKTTCAACEAPRQYTTVSDSLVAYLEQGHHVMKYRTLYCSLQKDRRLFPIYTRFPHVFQIWYLIQCEIPENFPIVYLEPDNVTPHLCIIFEKPSLHISCHVISQILQVCEFCEIALHMHRDHLALHVRTFGYKASSATVNAEVLQHKIDEMDISDDVKECYSKFYALLVACKVITDNNTNK
ncbi:docking protein [Elephant endotheliotropic herpesvirus 3A]|uniref:Docking protein n=1 Tax=Elephant endotheliotropic herpesvirus 3A TaxID=1329409 RepID=A0A866VST9_9BETA|nr:docking protein [Elephant endotheliotropic herpesvirus 3A]QOE74424.1 docking protein [Elephant endotheliotropic herpesvirus 3A]